MDVRRNLPRGGGYSLCPLVCVLNSFWHLSELVAFEQEAEEDNEVGDNDGDDIEEEDELADEGESVGSEIDRVDSR